MDRRRTNVDLNIIGNFDLVGEGSRKRGKRGASNNKRYSKISLRIYIYKWSEKRRKDSERQNTSLHLTERISKRNTSLFKKLRSRVISREGKVEGESGAMGERWSMMVGVGTITERAGCGRSCLADAPNSVGRADVKQTTGN